MREVPEFAKLAVIIYAADFLTRKRQVIKEFMQGFLPPMVVLSVVFSLLLFEPDFGTAMVISAVMFTMLFVAGIRLAHILPMVIVSFPVMYQLIWQVGYRRQRVFAFLHPDQLPTMESGYQVFQSLVAIGSGGLFGVAAVSPNGSGKPASVSTALSFESSSIAKR